VRIAQITHATWRDENNKRPELRCSSRRCLLPVPVVASLTGPVEIATWAPVAAWAVAAATATALAPRAAPITLGHDPVAVGDALGFLEHGLA
jgi:hypothetical protein